MSLGPFLLFLACPLFLSLYTIVIENLRDRPVPSRPVLQETLVGSEDIQAHEWDNLANHWLSTLVGYSHSDTGSENCCKDQPPNFLLSPGSYDE